MTTRPERVALAGVVITVVLALAKLAVWAATGSLAVLSQALDSVVDLVALGLVFVAVRFAAKPPDETHHYGHDKAENLAAFTQTLILGGIAAWIAFEAISRLTVEAEPVASPWYALALMAGSAAVDVVRVALFTVAARSAGSEALRAGALNLATDVGTALVALISLVAVRTGMQQADAVGALIVVAAVALAAVRVGKRSVDVLMDRAPHAQLAAIAAAAGAVSGVQETRRVRVRGSGEHLFADVTVAAGRTTSLERAHDIAEDVEREIERQVPGTDVVVHVEPISETTGLVERVQAAASRVLGVREVHNVLVHAFDDRGTRKLHVTLHAKVEAKTSLAESHQVADRVEAAIVDELGRDVRVDAHLEPLLPTAFAQDVTARRNDVVETVARAATAESDVLDCHEVLVHSTDGAISVVAHVCGRADLALERIHTASERIESVVRAAHPDVASVLIHFEPA